MLYANTPTTASAKHLCKIQQRIRSGFMMMPITPLPVSSKNSGVIKTQAREWTALHGKGVPVFPRFLRKG
jgi:hypothetical protein